MVSSLSAICKPRTDIKITNTAPSVWTKLAKKRLATKDDDAIILQLSGNAVERAFEIDSSRNFVPAGTDSVHTLSPPSACLRHAAKEG